MPLQTLFTNALLNDIENSHLLQQTIAALQANKFVQVKIYIYTVLFFLYTLYFFFLLFFFLNSSVPLENSFFLSLFCFFVVVVLKCPWQPLLGRKNEMEKQRKEIKELWKQEQNKMVSIIIVSSICEHLKIMSNLSAYIPREDAYLIL